MAVVVFLPFLLYFPRFRSVCREREELSEQWGNGIFEFLWSKIAVLAGFDFAKDCICVLVCWP